MSKQLTQIKPGDEDIVIDVKDIVERVKVSDNKVTVHLTYFKSGGVPLTGVTIRYETHSGHTSFSGATQNRVEGILYDFHLNGISTYTYENIDKGLSSLEVFYVREDK